MIRLWLLLRLLLLLDAEGGTDGDGDGDDADHGDSDQPDDGVPPGDGGGHDDEDGEIKDPKARIKALKDQVGRLAMKLDKKDGDLRKRDKRIKELEDQAKASGEAESEDVRSARLESHFLRVCIARDEPIDIETGWDLATARNFLDAVKPDGEGMEEAISRLVEAYPWLASDPDADADSEEPSPLPRTRHPRAPQGGQPRVANKKALKKRFPSLQRGGR